jgi:hypothetical protein
MGQIRSSITIGGRAVAVAALLLAPLLVSTGCQQAHNVSHRRLIEHQALIDFSGLKPAQEIDTVKVHAAMPRNWDKLVAQVTPLYTHQQWRSPSTRTGVGVAYIHLPVPINMNVLMWLAKREYTKRGSDGKILSEWTDDLGRPWFEAENAKYRVRGYVVVSGFQAWVVYFGNKVKLPPDPAEMSLAARAAESIVPDIGGSKPSPPPGEQASASAANKSAAK